MPDVSNQSFISQDPGAYLSTTVGTTTTPGTILTRPGFFHSIFFPNRVASGSAIIYNSVGTSTNVIGTIVLGTQTFSDPPPPYEFDRAVDALTVVNSANLGAIVLYR